MEEEGNLQELICSKNFRFNIEGLARGVEDIL